MNTIAGVFKKLHLRLFSCVVGAHQDAEKAGIQLEVQLPTDAKAELNEKIHVYEVIAGKNHENTEAVKAILAKNVTVTKFGIVSEENGRILLSLKGTETPKSKAKTDEKPAKV